MKIQLCQPVWLFINYIPFVTYTGKQYQIKILLGFFVTTVLHICVLYFPLYSTGDGTVSLMEFDSTMEGIVESSVIRWSSYDEELETTWLNDRHYWPCPSSPQPHTNHCITIIFVDLRFSVLRHTHMWCELGTVKAITQL